MGNPGRVIETQFNRCIKGEVKLMSNRTKKFELPIDKDTTLESIPNLEEFVAVHLGIDVLDIMGRIEYPCIVDNTRGPNPFHEEEDEDDKYFSKLKLKVN
jgi:hypothetical protein